MVSRQHLQELSEGKRWKIILTTWWFWQSRLKIGLVCLSTASENWHYSWMQIKRPGSPRASWTTGWLWDSKTPLWPGRHPGMHQEASVVSRSSKCSFSSTPPWLRPHLEYHVPFWASQFKKVRELLEWVKQSTTEMIRALEHLFCEERMRDLELFSLE